MLEVADVVRVPVATLRYWRHLGTGPRTFRIGRSVRYWRTEVRLARRPGQWRPPERRLTSCPLPTWRQYLTVSTGAQTSSASSLVLRLLS